jgi:hypothetical protein
MVGKAEVSSLKAFSGELVISLQALQKSHYNTPLLKEILNAFPRDGTEIENAIENLLQLKNSQQSDEMQKNQSVDVVRGQKRLVGGASRGVKRPVSVSEDSDEDEKSVTTVTKSNAKAFSTGVEKRKKLSNEESDRDKGINKF